MANLINGLGGPVGFGPDDLSPNDDSSTGAIDITAAFPGGINLFGQTYSSIYINNNGNITFQGPLSTYTPEPIGTDYTAPIIAPFWADVYTLNGTVTPTGGNSAGTNLVWYDVDAASHTVTVTWDDVGYFNADDKVNAFQLQLIAEPNGFAEIKFIYQNIEWTTGDASGGTDGLGGYPARIGYSAGNGVNQYEIPASANQAALLALPSTPGNTGLPGIYIFQSGLNGIYGFASSQINTAQTIAFGAYHVDASAPTQAVSITNAAAAPAESLDANVGSVDPGLIGSGSFSLLAAGQTNASSIVLGIDTTTPGLKDGDVILAFASDGQGTSGFGQTALGNQTIAVTGVVYALAIAGFADTDPILHVGDPETQTLTVRNTSGFGIYSEGLIAVVAGTGGHVMSASGTTELIADGTQNTTALTYDLPTSDAGQVTGTIDVALTSDGTGTSGLGNTSLGTQAVAIDATIDNFATAQIVEISGGATLVQDGDDYTLNLGTVTVAATELPIQLGIENSASSFADLLEGSFSVSGSSAIEVTGATPFSGVAAQGDYSGLNVSLNTGMAGTFSEQIVMTPTGYNASGYAGTLQAETLTVTGTVVSPQIIASGGQLTQDGNQYVLNLGDVTQGDTPELVAISIDNNAGGLADSLSSQFDVSGNGAFFNSGFGSISDLNAGAVGLAGYAVLDTSTPGEFTEAITVNSEGADIGALPTQTIIVTGDVQTPPPPPLPLSPPPLPESAPVTLPNSLGEAKIAPQTIDFGNITVGSDASQFITVTNNSDPSGNGLDAEVGDLSGSATGSGSITDLAPGAINSNAIDVGIDTSSSGEKTGTVTINLASDSNTPSTLEDTSLDFQTKDQSIFGTGEPTLPSVSKVLSSGTASGSTTLSAGPYSLALNGSISNVLKANLGFLSGVANVDYPVDASVDLPGGFVPGQSFTVQTGQTGYGALKLDTDFSGLTDVSLTDMVTGNLNGTAVLPSLTPPFTSSTTFNYSPSLLNLSLGVDGSTPSLSLDAGPASASISLPGPVTTSMTLPADSSATLPELMSKGSSNSFAKASGNLLALLPGAEALDVNLPGGTKLELAALNLSLGLALGQQFIFTPTAIDVSISPNFDPSADETGLLGDAFSFDAPAGWDQPVVLTSTYSIEGTLTSQTGLIPQLSAALEAGTLKISAGSLFGIPVNVNLGPLFSAAAPPLNGNLLTLFQQQFPLDGFNDVTEQYVIPVESGANTGGADTNDLPSQTIDVEANVTAPTASASGCPYFTTFDGLGFWFQGAGEFVAAKSTVPGNNFQVQMRLEPEGSPTSSVSIITQIAVQVGTDRVTFASPSSPNADASRAQVVWVDGASVAISQANPIVTLAGGTITEVSSNEYQVMLNTGEVVTVNPFGDGMGLSIQLAPTDGPGSVQGFFGSDSGQANDFQLPDGTVLQQPLTQDQLYQEFANAWRVTDATSLLDYGPGQTTATFTDTQYPREILTLSDFSPEVVAAAMAAVATDGITDPTLAAVAAFDYITMGNPGSIGEAAAAGGVSSITASTPAVITAQMTPPPSIGVLAAAASVGETTGSVTPVTFSVDLTSSTTIATVVDYALAPGASNTGLVFLTNADFGGTGPSGAVTIAAGQTVASFTVDVLNSAIGAVPDKLLQVSIASPSGDFIYGTLAQSDIVNNSPVAGAAAQPVIELLPPSVAVPSQSPAVLTESGNDYTLNLGQVVSNTVMPALQFAIANMATAPADGLSATVSTVTGEGFLISGTQTTGTIQPGNAFQDLYLTPQTNTLGIQSETLTVASNDVNGTGYSASLPNLTLTLNETVVPCFARGTRIATPSGYSTVERLHVGDLVLTRSGRARPVVWIGERKIDCRRHIRPQAVLPVLIQEGAFADNVPERDLVISPDHAVFFDGALIPIKYLINGITVVQQTHRRKVHYFHVELDRHDVLSAEGLEVESYLDTGDRNMFANGGGPMVLHPDFSQRTWEAAGYAPLAVTGKVLNRLRRQLKGRVRHVQRGRTYRAVG